LRFELARNAQARLVENDFSTRRRAKRLVTASRKLLSKNLAEVSREDQLATDAETSYSKLDSEPRGAAHSNPQPVGDPL
jgi:hypothetical protein